VDWTDDAILLAVRQTAKRVILVEALTRQHGRCQVSITLEGSLPTLLPGSQFTLSYRAALSGGETGDGKITDINGGISVSSSEDVAVPVMTSIKEMSALCLELNEPIFDLFDATGALLGSLMLDDGRWPVTYAAWEFALATELELVEGWERCRSALRNGEAIYMSPRSGKVVTRAEAGAFLDRMLPMPGFLMGVGTGTPAEVRQALHTTGSLLGKVPQAGSNGLPAVRRRLIAIAETLESLPPPMKRSEAQVDEVARKRRMLASRPLMVTGQYRP
jgi:DNA repair protein RecO (recombination protein O)